MSARSTMTMRAEVERDNTSTTNAWNRPDVANFVLVGTIPCRAYSKAVRDVDDDGKSAVLEDMRAIVPAGADVEEEDRLVIKDRLGLLQFGGPVLVEGKQRRGGSGSRAGHFELILRRHSRGP